MMETENYLKLNFAKVCRSTVSRIMGVPNQHLNDYQEQQ